MSPEQWREFLDSLSPDLKERVKEIMRDAMDAAQGYQTDIQDGVINVPYRELRDEFRALCAPEVRS